MAKVIRLKSHPQFVIILLLVLVTEVAVVVLGYIYRAKVVCQTHYAMEIALFVFSLFFYTQWTFVDRLKLKLITPSVRSSMSTMAPTAMPRVVPSTTYRDR